MKGIHIKIIISCLMLSSFSIFSCKKDKKNCVKVQYVMPYCPKKGADLVRVLETNPDATAHTEHGYTTYSMALLNLPEEYKVRDKVFFVKYEYDADSAKPDTTFCPAIFGHENILIAKSVSLTGCDN